MLRVPASSSKASVATVAPAPAVPPRPLRAEPRSWSFSTATAVIPKLVRPILDGQFDFVIGSRTRGVREHRSMGAHQVLAGHVIGAAIGLLYGTRYTDMCAFRAIRAEALAGLGMREMTYGWNLEMQMRAARARLRVLEVPVPYGRRVAGRSKVAGTLRGTLKAGSRILATFVRIARERRSPENDHR